MYWGKSKANQSTRRLFMATNFSSPLRVSSLTRRFRPSGRGRPCWENMPSSTRWWESWKVRERDSTFRRDDEDERGLRLSRATPLWSSSFVVMRPFVIWAITRHSLTHSLDPPPPYERSGDEQTMRRQCVRTGREIAHTTSGVETLLVQITMRSFSLDPELGMVLLTNDPLPHCSADVISVRPSS